MSDVEEIHQLLDAAWAKLKKMEGWDDEGWDGSDDFFESYIETTEPKVVAKFLNFLMKNLHHYEEQWSQYMCFSCGHTAEKIPRPCPCLSEEAE